MRNNKYSNLEGERPYKDDGGHFDLGILDYKSQSGTALGVSVLFGIRFGFHFKEK